MKIVSQNKIDEAANILKEGGIIAFPTETVFGLGVIFDNKVSYDNLILVKRRPPEKPFTLMLSDIEDIEKYAVLNKYSRKLIGAFMPGQFTLITKAKNGLPSWCVSSTGEIGIRIPDYNLVRRLIRKTGKGLLVPSANKSGEAPALSSEEVQKIFNDEIDCVIEGKSVSNVPSTIVIVNDEKIKVIREGVIKIKDIEKVLAEVD